MFLAIGAISADRREDMSSDGKQNGTYSLCQEDDLSYYRINIDRPEKLESIKSAFCAVKTVYSNGLDLELDLMQSIEDGLREVRQGKLPGSRAL